MVWKKTGIKNAGINRHIVNKYGALNKYMNEECEEQALIKERGERERAIIKIKIKIIVMKCMEINEK